MWNDDDELEKYLNEFRPREVRPLEPARELKSTRWIRRLAAAAVLAASVGTVLWYAEHKEKTDRVAEMPTVRIEFHAAEPPNAIVLTKMALEDPRRFEEKMNEASRLVLPDLRGPQSTLRVLAKQ